MTAFSSAVIVSDGLPGALLSLERWSGLWQWSNLPVGISLLIACLVLAAMCCQVSLWRRYRRLTGRLQTIRSRLIGSVSLQMVKDESWKVLDRSQREGPDALLIKYLLHAFGRGAEFQVAPAIDARREQESQLARAAFARWVMGAALVMGLAGTFAAFIQLIAGSGLLEALSALRAAPASAGAAGGAAPAGDSYAQLSAAFGNVYQGFSHAFFASLAGLIGTIFLGFGHTMGVARARVRCLTRMEEFGDDILRPLLAPSHNPMAGLSEALQAAAGVLKDSGRTADSLHAVSQALDQASTRFAQTQGANSQMVTTLTRLAEEIETSHERWELLLAALRESKVTMSQSVEEFKKEAAAQRELTNAATAKAAAGMRELAARLATEIQQVAAAKTEHFHAVQTEVQRALLQSKQDWEAASAAVLAKTDEGFDRALTTVREVIQDGRQDAAQAREEIAALARETAAAVSTHQEVLETHARAVSDSLAAWGGAPAELAGVVRGGEDALRQLSGVLNNVEKMPARWEQRVLGPIARLEGKLEATNAHLAGRAPALKRWWDGARGLFNGKRGAG